MESVPSLAAPWTLSIGGNDYIWCTTGITLWVYSKELQKTGTEFFVSFITSVLLMKITNCNACQPGKKKNVRYQIMKGASRANSHYHACYENYVCHKQLFVQNIHSRSPAIKRELSYFVSLSVCVSTYSLAKQLIFWHSKEWHSIAHCWVRSFPGSQMCLRGFCIN